MSKHYYSVSCDFLLKNNFTDASKKSHALTELVGKTCFRSIDGLKFRYMEWKFTNASHAVDIFLKLAKIKYLIRISVYKV